MAKKMNLAQKMIASFVGIPINLTGDNDQFYDRAGSGLIAGERVDNKSALGIATTWANVNLLSSTIGSTPLDVYRQEGKTRVVESGHPVSFLLKDSPNSEHTPLEFWELGQASLELGGNSYSEKKFGVRGDVVALEPINPQAMTVRRRDFGLPVYSWIDPTTKARRSETSDKILHIRTRLSGANGMTGLSTLSSCKHSFAMAQATNKSAETMFGNGARPSGLLSTELPMTAKERKELEEILQEKFAGAMNHNRPMVLDNKLTWQQLSLNANDAQMLESRRFSVEEVCLIFGVPPHMIGYTAGAAVSKTLTEQTHGFHKYTLRPRYKRIEQALEKQLLTITERRQGLKIRFNLESLLRGVSKERSAFYGAGLKDGWFTVNEVRALEGLPAVPGGDVPRTQMQNVPLTDAGKKPKGGDNAT